MQRVLGCYLSNSVRKMLPRQYHCAQSGHYDTGSSSFNPVNKHMTYTKGLSLKNTGNVVWNLLIENMGIEPSSDSFLELSCFTILDSSKHKTTDKPAGKFRTVHDSSGAH
jgi:hypothetical protein